MTTNISITLSKETTKLRAICAELVKERDTLRSKSGEILGDDSKELNAASETLSALRAREEIVLARLPRRRAELYAGFCADLTKMFDAAEAQNFKARDALREAKAEYRQRILAEHNRNAAEALLIDPSLLPKSVTKLQTALDLARKVMRETGMLRGTLDKAFAEVGALTRAAHIAGESYIKPVEWYWKNAAPYVPELYDEPVADNGPAWMIKI